MSNEALDAVETINFELFDLFQKEENGRDVTDHDLLAQASLTYVATGAYEAVVFLDHPIWDTESDPREVDETKKGYRLTPPLVDFLRQRMRDTVAALFPIHQLGQPKAVDIKEP